MVELLISEVRKAKGVSLRELSRKSGVALGYLSELENPYHEKKNPTIYTLCRIAKGLEVAPEKLYKPKR